MARQKDNSEPGAAALVPAAAGRPAAAGLEAHSASPWRRAPERTQERAVKREAVIRTAAQAFRVHGFHNTSLDDIAAALAVTKPTVYYYVTSKEQLLFECFLAGLGEVRAAFSDAGSAGRTGRERLKDVLRHYAAAITSEFGWCMVHVEDQDLSPTMSRHVKALKSAIDHGIRALIGAGIDDGSIRPCDPRMTGFALAGALNSIAHWYRREEPQSAAQIADAFVALFEDGLRPRASD